jgi:hypothetical protein
MFGKTDHNSDTSPAPLGKGDHMDVMVSNHAIHRLRQRFGCFRRWTGERCERWIMDMVKQPDFMVRRSTGEILIRTSVGPRSLFFAVMPSADGASCLVRTVLPHAFAVNNLTRRGPQPCGPRFTGG